MTVTTIAIAWGALAALTGLFILVMTGLNTVWLAHGDVQPAKEGQKVSVLIPARNEERHIQPCVESLLEQTYESYEIIVYDDDSTDRTGAILDRLAAENPDSLRVIHGKGVPKGWYGKPHAMQRLSEAAEGSWLLFTDADTVHKPESVGKAVSIAESYGADLVSGYIRHEVASFGETEVVPAIYLLSMVAMPLWLIHITKSPLISHAIGQYMFFKTSVYKKIGGYASVRDKVSEDVRIARLLKKNGGKIFFADLKFQASCRMYDSYESAITGLSKNVYDYLGKNFLVLLLGTIAVPLLFFIPIVGSCWLPASLGPAQPFFRFHVMVTLYSWALLAMDRMLPWYLPFIYPLVLINVLSTAWRAFRLFLTGKAIEWKGRMVK